LPPSSWSSCVVAITMRKKVVKHGTQNSTRTTRSAIRGTQVTIRSFDS
jgi:hypothetical protein